MRRVEQADVRRRRAVRRYGGSGSNLNVPDLRGRTTAGKDNMGGTAAGLLSTRPPRPASRRGSPTPPRIGEADLGSTGVAPHPAGVDPGHSHGPPTTTNFVNAYGGTNFLTVANPGSIGST